MNHFVYILVSEVKEKWSYVGSTSNIKQRINDHNYGKTRSTKAYRPLKLVYTEEYSDRNAAYERELYFKSGYGREERYNIIKNSEVV